MRILIIEDSPSKMLKMKGVLASHFSSCELICRESFNSGLSAAIELSPELIVLDMTLPNFDREEVTSRQGRVRPLGGYDVMDKIKLRSVQSKVVVVTQLESFGDDRLSFDDVTNKCFIDFPDMFLGSVYYDQINMKWSDDLLKLVDEFIKGFSREYSYY